MYNSGRRGKRASDGYGIISQADKFYQTEYSIPVVTSFAVTDGSYVPLDDTAVDTAGGQTIVLYGSGFAPGATVTVGGVTIGAVTYLDQGRLTFTAPAKSSGSYTVVVINSNGGAGILVPGLVYSGVPVWSTSAGSVGSVYETTSVSSTFVATGDAPMTYSVLSGSLPPGTTLSTTGVLSGSAPIESGSTTYSFTIRATDGQLQDTDRSFSLTVNTDLVTFSSPTNNQVITSYEYKPISNVTVAATSAAGYGVVYSSNTRPTGITLNATTGVISGTANTAGNTYTRLTATANTTSRTATRDVVFNVNPDVVTWNTPTDNYTISAYEYSAISNVTANATSAAGFGVLYSANATPTGITLDANTGLISGAPTTVGNTYSLLTATANTTTRSNTRNIIYNVNQDVVTWSSPADGTTYSLSGGSAIANVTLAATSAAGKTITYTANALPSGLGISGNVIYGTPDTAQTVTTLLTATAATTNRSATRTISWSISLGDTYWKNVSLLLNGNTPTPSFINDASLNNNQLSIFGDTKPNNFDPYTQGYYSNYFDGTGDYLSLPNSSNFAFGAGDFTIEFWINTADTGGGLVSQAATGGWAITIYGNTVYWQSSYNSVNLWTYSAATITNNLWHHLAFSRISGSTKFFIDGVLVATNADTTNYAATTGSINIGRDANPADLIGYISNLRIIKGTAVYTGAFTPPTTPLSAIANTSLLTCQSNRLIDNSVNNFTITKNGDTTVSSAHPFTTPTTAAYNTGYSAIFDGTGDYLTVATSSNMSLTGDFTVEFWIYNSSASWGSYSMVGIVGANKSRIYTDSSSILHLYNGAAGTLNWYTGVGDLALNTWYHFSFSRVGSTLKFYVNGTSRTMTTASGSVTETIDFNGTMFIGGTSAASVMAAGMISNLRVINGTGLYSANFTPPTSALTAVANTQLLTCQDSTFKDNSTNAYVITSYNQAQPIAVSPFTMTTSNTTVTSLGSAYFDGTGDYLSVPINSAFTLGTSDHTIEFWMYLSGSQSGYATQWKYSSGSTQQATNDYYFQASSAGGATFNLLLGASGSWGVNISNSSSYTNSLNTWTHVAITRSGNSFRLFVNGIQVGSTVTYSGSVGAQGGAMLIGQDGSGNYMTGYITDFRFIKGTALYTSNFLPPQATLTAVANTQLLTCQTNGGATNNGFVDQSSFNNIITRNGNTTQGTFSPYSQTGWSNYFDGTSDALTTSATTAQWALMHNGSDWTVETWLYYSSTTYCNILYNSGTAASYGFRLFYNNSTDDKIVNLRLYNNSTYISTASSAALIPNSWNYVAVTYTGNTNAVNFYINGSLTNGTYTNVNYAPSNNPASGNTGIGGRASGAEAITGYLSNLRVSSIVRPNLTTIPTAPLISDSSTFLLTCQSNRLIDNSPNNFTITKVGDVSVQAFSPFGSVTSVPTSYSTYNDGSASWYYYPLNWASIGTGDYTLEGWIFPTALATYKVPFASAEAVLAPYLMAGGEVRVFGVGGYATATTASGTIVVNQWQHLAIVRNNGTFKIYVNGVLKLSTTTSGWVATDMSVYTTGENAQLGICRSTSWASAWFSGYVSNVRMSKVARYTTASTTVGDVIFTAPTSPFTSDANTLVLAAQSNIIIDNGPNKYSAVVDGTTLRQNPFNPFGLTNTSGVSYTPIVNGGSMYFDGTGDSLTIASNASNNIGSGNFTLEWWMYPTNISATNQSLFFTGSSNLVVLMVGGTGIIQPGNYQNTGIVNPSTGVQANAWTHVAITRSGNVWNVYYNGVLAGTNSNYSFTPNTSTFSIGTGASPYYGYLSDYKLTVGSVLYTSNFYPGAAPMTPTTTIGANTYSSSLYLTGTSGGIIDYHGTNNLETVGNTQLASEDPYAGSYYSVTADSNAVNLAYSGTTFGTGAFTVEMWYNVSSTGGSFVKYLIYSASTGAFRLQINGGTTIRMFSSGLTTQTFTVPQWQYDTWYHIVYTRDSSGNATVFVNGVRSSTGSISDTNNYSVATTQVGGGTYTMFSNVRFVTGTSVYDPTASTITVPTSPLTAISGTQLLTCQSNSFKDNSINNYTITPTAATHYVKSYNPFRQNTGKSLYFDGTGDYMVSGPSSSYSMGTGNFTVECWIYSISNTAGSGNGIFDFNTSAAFGSSFSLVLISNQLYDAATGLQGSTTIVNGTWNHVAMVRSSGTQKTYLNGVQQTTGTVNTNQTQTYLLVGGYYTTSNLFNGYIKDLRITKGIARYTATFTPPTTTFEVK